MIIEQTQESHEADHQQEFLVWGVHEAVLGFSSRVKHPKNQSY